MSSSSSSSFHNTTPLLPLLRVGHAGIAYPFGDERSVIQAFPSGISEQDADPFLMCDFFSSTEQQGPAQHPDDFPIDWHPHRGFDIASYLKSGTGRHGDSLGNRETYETPGMQWMSTGSGVYHAEGGANAKGQLVTGFQIWINVPSNQKMLDPRYGTVPPQDLPTVQNRNTQVRVLAGEFSYRTTNEDKEPTTTTTTTTVVKGPFATVQPVQMLDLELEAPSSGDSESPQSAATTKTTLSFDIAPDLDTAMLFVYEGELELSLSTSADDYDCSPVPETTMQTLHTHDIALLDAAATNNNGARGIALTNVSNKKACAMLFAGKKLQQPIAWRGPIVMTTQDELVDTFVELRAGTFPPVRVDWDYRRAEAKPIKEEL